MNTVIIVIILQATISIISINNQQPGISDFVSLKLSIGSYVFSAIVMRPRVHAAKETKNIFHVVLYLADQN